MAEAGEACDIDITGLGHDGRGVGRADGMAVFVPGLIPGDRARVRVVRRRASFAEAELLELLAPSPDRAEPFCPSYGRCGGCSLQHMAYPAQLQWKRTRVVDALVRLGGVVDAQERVLPATGMAEPFAYRHKAAMPVRSGCAGGAVVASRIGFFARDSHEVVDFEACRIQHPAGLAVREAVRAWMAREGVPAYDEAARTGLVRHVVVRTSRSVDEVQVVLVLACRELTDEDGRPVLPWLDQLAAEMEVGLTGCGAKLAGLVLNAQPAPGARILGERYLCVYGREDIEETLDGLVFRLSPASFFQINPEQAAVLYRVAADWAVGEATDTVYDLYCGAGTISCFLARKARRVIGIESEPAAVRDAEANAERNGLGDRLTFVAGRAEVALGDLADSAEADTHAYTIVMDPPRRGCDPALLDTLIRMQPGRIVYVSCEPSTLARDVRKLAEGGYRVERVQPVDMFPWTEHVESVVLMSRVTF